MLLGFFTMYIGNGTLLCTFNRRGTFSLFFQQKNLQVKKRGYQPTNLAFRSDVLVMLKDFIILKGICTHARMLTLSLQRQHKQITEECFRKSQPASLKQACSYIAFPIYVLSLINRTINHVINARAIQPNQ